MDTDEGALVAMLRALAEPTRLGVVRLLSTAPRRAGDLSQALRVTRAGMSKHLRVLLAAGIVTDERAAGDARGRVFHLRGDSVAGLRAWLDQLQAQWDEQRVQNRPAAPTSGRSARWGARREGRR